MKPTRPLRLTLLAGAQLVAISAFADDQADLMKIMLDPSYKQSVINVAARSTVFMQNPCPSAQFRIDLKYTVLQKPVFDASNGIVSGAWKHHIYDTGCGSERTLNVIVRTGAPHKLSFTPMLPGTTRADPLLQKDAVKIVVQSASSSPDTHEPNPCNIGYVADTEFIEQETTALPGEKGTSWRERWTLMSCTKKVEVPVRFIPDATGTSISAGPSDQIKVTAIDEKH